MFQDVTWKGKEWKQLRLVQLEGNRQMTCWENWLIKIIYKQVVISHKQLVTVHAIIETIWDHLSMGATTILYLFSSASSMSEPPKLSLHVQLLASLSTIDIGCLWNPSTHLSCSGRSQSLKLSSRQSSSMFEGVWPRLKLVVGKTKHILACSNTFISKLQFVLALVLEDYLVKPERGAKNLLLWEMYEKQNYFGPRHDGSMFSNRWNTNMGKIEFSFSSREAFRGSEKKKYVEIETEFLQSMAYPPSSSNVHSFWSIFFSFIDVRDRPDEIITWV